MPSLQLNNVTPQAPFPVDNYATSAATALSITTATVVKPSPGHLVQIDVLVAGSTVGKVNDCTTVASARAAVTKLDETRREHALAAATGDAAASNAVLEARASHVATNLEVEDLAAALVEAKGKLGEAQAVHAAASRARTREIAAEIISRRIAAAERFDEGVQATADAYRDFNDIGDELGALPNFDGLGDLVSGVSRRENVAGVRRVESALPAFCVKLDASRAASASLKRSEEIVWQGYR